MTRWTLADLGRLDPGDDQTAPLVDAGAVPRVLAGEDIWDPWPLQEEDGTPAVVDGAELWMALAAPAAGHPEARHDVARLRAFAVRDGAWQDLGPVFADGATPGSREWSGSAVRRQDGRVSVFYTVAGERGEARVSYVQRAFEASMTLTPDGGRPPLRADGPQRELVRPDGAVYLLADERDGAPGTVRAFRDPAWFLDPATGAAHLLVAASVPDGSGFAGAVARADGDAAGWTLRPPLLVADGVNHELERPHVVVHDGRYHLFVSAHRYAFHGVEAPTGLYGFVADRLAGPYRPLNGSGLVVRNPPQAPDQAYAWLVLPDLRVVSFLNYRAVDGRDSRELDAASARAAFGGTVAPELRLAIDGDRTAIVR